MAESPAAINPDQLSEALLRVTLPEYQGLLKRLPPLQANLDTPREQVARILAEVGRGRPGDAEDLLKRLQEKLGALDRSLVNCVLFMERAAKQWDNISPLDDFVRKAFMQRRYVFAAVLLDQPEFVLDDEHPMAQLLSRVERLFMGWEEKNGQPPAFIMKALSALTHLLDDDTCLNSAEQKQALEVLTQEWQRERKRRQTLEQRLVQTELGLDKARYIQYLTTHELNRRLQGQLLPETVSGFLKGPWLDSIRLALNEKGVEGDTLPELLKLTDKLVFAFRPIRNDRDFERLYNFAVGLIDDIARNLLSLIHAPVELQQQIDRLEEMLMKVIKREDNLEREQPELLLQEVEISDKPVDAEAVEELVGQWFRRFDRLCKVLVYLPQQKKVLWSDFAGRKAGTDNAADLLEEHEAGKLEAFNDQTRLHGVFQASAKAFISIDRLERLKQREQLKIEKQQREEARRKAEAEAAAIEQARLEAEEQARIEREATQARLQQEQMEQAEREALEKLTEARSVIDGLKLGDPVTLVREDKTVSATLAVRLNAARKLIFTDAIGLKVAELHRDDAVQEYMKGTLQLGDADGQSAAMRARFMGRMGIGRR